MKIKTDYITQQVGKHQYMIPTGQEAENFKGMIRGNKTAAAIIDLLKQETTEEAVTDAMLKRFDAPRERIAADVHKVVETLRSVGALEE